MFIPVRIPAVHIDYAPLERFGEAVGDLTKPLQAVGTRLLAAVEGQFATEGGWGGEPWRELTKGYKEWKEAQVPGLPMLIGVTRTGKGKPASYRASGVTKRTMLSPTSLFVTRHELVYSPNSEVAFFHQEGTPRMKPRPPVPFPMPAGEMQEWDLVFEGWLDGLITEMA